LKAKSSSTTLAAIQAYVNEISPAGDQIKHDAHGLATQLDAAQIPLWAEVTATWAAEAKDRYPGPLSPEAIAARKTKLDALVTFTSTAAANVEQNGSWFESIAGEIGSGIYTEPAHRGMELMMSLVGAVPTAP